MKLLVQLLIAVLVVNACVRAGNATWRYVEFKDAVAQEARFHGAETVARLRERILELAAEHDIDLAPVDLAIERDGNLTIVSAAYLDDIELVPLLYTREHLFEFEVSVTPVRPLAADEIK